MVVKRKGLFTAGTTDKKFPFEIECISQGRFPTIIVAGGRGYHDGTRRWLLGKRNEKLIEALDMDGITRMRKKGGT